MFFSPPRSVGAEGALVVQRKSSLSIPPILTGFQLSEGYCQAPDRWSRSSPCLHQPHSADWHRIGRKVRKSLKESFCFGYWRQSKHKLCASPLGREKMNELKTQAGGQTILELPVGIETCIETVLSDPRASQIHNTN